MPEDIYPEESSEKSFVFIQRKANLLSDDGSLNSSTIEGWVRKNASVYTLKTWEQAFYAAKKELFGSMYARSSDWPRVFWKAYKDDSVDPSSSLTHLINDSLRGRMRTSAFETEILAAPYAEVPREDFVRWSAKPVSAHRITCRKTRSGAATCSDSPGGNFCSISDRTATAFPEETENRTRWNCIASREKR